MNIEHVSLIQTVDRLIKEHEEDAIRLERMKMEVEKKIRYRDELVPKIALWEESRVFLQTLAEATRDEIMAGLQEVVTLCLQSVFGPHLSFEIEVETKRNSTGIEFYVVNTAGKEPIRLKPVGNMGGGVLDTISIGLRFGLLKILNPLPEGPLILDEPAKMVSGDRIVSITTLLKELLVMFGKQSIMVSHHVSLLESVDNAIHMRNEHGISIC